MNKLYLNVIKEEEKGALDWVGDCCCEMHLYKCFQIEKSQSRFFRRLCLTNIFYENKLFCRCSFHNVEVYGLKVSEPIENLDFSETGVVRFAVKFGELDLQRKHFVSIGKMIFVSPTKIKYIRKMFHDIDEFVTYNRVTSGYSDDEEDEEEDNKDQDGDVDC